MKSFKLLLVATLLTLGTLSVIAQTTTTTTDPMPRAKDYNTWSIGINAGISLLYGNATTEAYYKDRPVRDIGILYGATLKKSLSHLFGLEGQFAMGDIKGKDVQGSYFDGLHRFNNVLLNGVVNTSVKYDASINGVFTLGNFSWLTRKSKKFNLTGSIGWGMVNFNPGFTSDFNQKTSTVDTGKSFSKQGLGNTTEFIVPAGVGVVYNLSNH